jgi:DNA-binding MarR family transcriptional regulator
MQKGRQKNEVMLLCERYVALLLIRILDSPEATKLHDLSDIVSSFRTLDALTDRMAKEGMITKTLERRNYVTTFLELTPKGRAVAEKLKEAVEVFQGS